MNTRANKGGGSVSDDLVNIINIAIKKYSAPLFEEISMLKLQLADLVQCNVELTRKILNQSEVINSLHTQISESTLLNNSANSTETAVDFMVEGSQCQGDTRKKSGEYTKRGSTDLSNGKK